MKVLVTGSSGHLGEALMRVLRSKNIECIGIDILAGGYTDKVGSITDSKFISECIKGVTSIIHTATLHKPHVGTHSNQEFLDVNVSGTLNLLEASVTEGVQSFIFTSTTSTFGDKLRPPLEEPAIWVTEEIKPVPKNIYGVTKTAAEDLCQLFYRNHHLPCIILKTSRFFPEEDDHHVRRNSFDDENLKVNEFLNRRVDVEDVVSVHLLALEKAKQIGFGKYIISATSPFSENDLRTIRKDAVSVVEKLYPEFKEIYSKKKWIMNQKLDRVYVNDKARNELGWNPKFDFKYILECIKNGKEYKSKLTRMIGSKGYHDEVFEEGPYPVNE